MRKTTYDLVQEICSMGFDEYKIMDEVDQCLDEEFGGKENRSEGPKAEHLPDELYDSILFGYKCQKEAEEEQMEEERREMELFMREQEERLLY